MINGECTEPLRSLLEFESQRLGLPISYHRVDLDLDLPAAKTFKPEIEIYLHFDYQPQSFSIPVNGDELVQIRTSVCSEVPDSDATPVGPQINGEMVPLAYVNGRRIIIPFDLECLEPLNGASNVINRVFDVIADLAMNRAAEFIGKYSFKVEEESFAGVMTRALEKSIHRMQTDINENDYAISRKTQEIVELVQKNMEMKEGVECIKQVGTARKRENAIREFRELLKLQPKPFRSITFDDISLTAATGPIEIDHEDYVYDLGRFEVEIAFTTNSLEIRNQESDRIVDGYHHPHVNSSGQPCLGNISLSLTKLLAAKDYVPALILIHQYLQSYNADDAYLKLERWDPDWRDDEDESCEDCFRNAATLDCVECDRDGCPYWDDRHVRCAEFAQLYTCVRCRDCDEWNVQVEMCRDSSSPQSCVTCDESRCPNAGDVQLCYDEHSGDECIDCDNTDCKFYTEEEEDKYDHREDRPASP